MEEIKQTVQKLLDLTLEDKSETNIYLITKLYFNEKCTG